MLTEEVAEALQTLTLAEVKVLYWKCIGLDLSAIGDKIGGGEYLVGIHLNNICNQLDLDPNLHPTVLDRRLRQDFFPVLDALISRQGGIDALDEWPGHEPPPSPKPGLPVTALPVSNPTRPAARAGFEPIFLWLIVLLIILGTLLVLILPHYPLMGALSATPSVTPTATALPTGTPIPTYTPYPILFEDNFDNGLSAKWQTIAGEPRVTDGRLVGSPDVWLTLPESWTNYQVSFDGVPPGCGISNVNYIIPRFVSQKEYVGFYWSDCSTRWDLIHQGQESRITGSGKSGEWPGPSKVVLTVKGSLFFVSLDGSDHKSVVNDQMGQGVFSIHLGYGSWIDNLQIIQLPG